MEPDGLEGQDARIMASFRDRLVVAFERSGMTKAELSRRAGVNYHTLDSVLKGKNQSTSADTARKLALALGMDVQGDDQASRLLDAFYRCTPEQQRAILILAETLAAA
jgi:lambda repressor-like predicted transcriptional regulator